jgi:predicted DNA-binding transcriptional regulator AlpA
MTSTKGKFIGQREMMEAIGVCASTLRSWRLEGRGPAYVQTGKVVRYRRADVEQWLASREVQPPGQELYVPRVRT